jgi:hypothetical protein
MRYYRDQVMAGSNFYSISGSIGSKLIEGTVFLQASIRMFVPYYIVNNTDVF